MTRHLHDTMPADAADHPLPGTRPLAPGDWLRRDERFAEQMAEKDRLIAERRDDVIGSLPEGEAPARELLDAVCAELGVTSDTYARPDGGTIALDHDDPLGTLGRMVQEDFAIMVRGEDEHVLAAGTICFPSRWTLAEKLGRPLTRIHKPVDVYDDGVARRVQRLFDGVRVEQPLVRWNNLPYWTDILHNPKPEAEPREPPGPRPYHRRERQVLKRLPVSGAVVFSIHTYLTLK
ncbi:DUF3445 domain-containing protein [Maritimibacter sp. UBA3975]|uniref:heme-dependent oxidative N-demethylase family protein n=1 Tax=Maritimibacter sp. UBA3975 TaxID=1946833 RepID=UPI000C0955A2|nr:DUF3445 domain-containing protein [Maritimibacter sp. UBA3975]MAM60793.1 hypothetical protein [Maritimibacter sp.]|tara:strand:+ start:4586 stop:5287 length:702 start_codon:yes stop_codon:yes gene_type:complete